MAAVYGRNPFQGALKSLKHWNEFPFEFSTERIRMPVSYVCMALLELIHIELVCT